MDTPMEQPDLTLLLEKLVEKYEKMGQDMPSYLDGLLHTDYLTYWDYIRLDTLLSLQTPKTSFPDEYIFITFHQITELYFQLTLREISQITTNKNIDEKEFIMRITRMIRYFTHLVDSFDMMLHGMDKEEFLKFRMALLPSSGFQSVQYRLIELCSTDLIQLVTPEDRTTMSRYPSLETMMEKLYWKKGATELKSQKKTLTLRQFEQKYATYLLDKAQQYKNSNLQKIYIKRFPKIKAVHDVLREYDFTVNVLWPLAHLKSTSRHLHRATKEIEATGGTNWQKYLPPSLQKIRFFPELWSEQQKKKWGQIGCKRTFLSM